MMPFESTMDDRGGSRTRTAWLAVGRGIFVCALIVTVAGTAGESAASQDRKAAGDVGQSTVPLTVEARRGLVRWVIAQPAVAQATGGHRLAAVRVAAATVTDSPGKTRTVVTAVLFDHTALEAWRVALDAVSGELLSSERLPGRPQSSAEEFEEAVQIVRGDATLARLLDGGAVLDGGFIVDDPGGSRRRMIQLKLVSADRRTPIRTITVDLTRQRIASAGAAGVLLDPRPSRR